MEDIMEGDLVSYKGVGCRKVKKTTKDGFLLFEDGYYTHVKNVEKIKEKDEKDLVIDLMYKKDKLIKKHADYKGIKHKIPDYFDHIDARHIKQSWSNEDARFVLDHLKKAFNKNGPLQLDSDTCPHCIINHVVCSKCSYGSRHGVCCHEMNDDYKRIIGIVGKINVKEVIKDIVEEYEKLRSKKSTPNIKPYSSHSTLDPTDQKYLNLDQDSIGRIHLNLYSGYKYLQTVATIDDVHEDNVNILIKDTKYPD